VEIAERWGTVRALIQIDHDGIFKGGRGEQRQVRGI